MNCQTCNGSNFIRRRCVGLVCGDCNPSDSDGLIRLYRKHKARAKVIGTATSVTQMVLLGCKDCKMQFELTVGKAAYKIHAGKHPCPSCDRPRQLQAMSDTLKHRYSLGEIAPTRIRKMDFEEYCSNLAARKIRCLESAFPVRECSGKGMRHECMVCNHKFTNMSYNMMRGNGCAKCSGVAKKTTASYAKELAKLPDCKYKVIGEYTGARTPVLHKCLTCGGERAVTPDNMLRKFYYKCPSCSPAVGGFKTYTYTLGDRKVLLQGYEKFALDLLLTRFEPTDIRVSKDGNIPTIRYTRNGSRSHRPDIFVESKNAIVEVKSMYTLGVNAAKNKDGRNKWNDQRAKYRAATKLGYKYVLMVFNERGQKLKLPENWHLLRAREFRLQVLQLNRRK